MLALLTRSNRHWLGWVPVMTVHLEKNHPQTYLLSARVSRPWPTWPYVFAKLQPIIDGKEHYLLPPQYRSIGTVYTRERSEEMRERVGHRPSKFRNDKITPGSGKRL